MVWREVRCELLCLRKFHLGAPVELELKEEKKFVAKRLGDRTQLRQYQVHSCERNMPEGAGGFHISGPPKRCMRNGPCLEEKNSGMHAKRQFKSGANHQFPREFALQSWVKGNLEGAGGG